MLKQKQVSNTEFSAAHSQNGYLTYYIKASSVHKNKSKTKHVKHLTRQVTYHMCMYDRMATIEMYVEIV